MERKNIKEEEKEGKWENQKKICFSSLTHAWALGMGHTLVVNIFDVCTKPTNIYILKTFFYLLFNLKYAKKRKKNL